jgi:hypothetical protein
MKEYYKNENQQNENYWVRKWVTSWKSSVDVVKPHFFSLYEFTTFQ